MNLANLITLARIAMIPFFIIAVVYGRNGLACALFFVSGVSDALDGLIARRWNLKTKMGAFLDPTADKLMMASAFIALTIPHADRAFVIPLWLTILVFSRDLIISLTALILFLSFGTRTFPPSWLGKTSTVVQVSFIVNVLAHNYWHTVGFFQFMLPVLTWGTMLFTIASGLHYIWLVYRGGFRPPGENNHDAR